MPDLTTMHLKCLLEQAETMPWKSSVEVYGVPEGWDEWGLALNTGRFWLSTWSPGPVSEEELDCLELAALAPQLAQEVLRMRRELESMQRAWLLMYADPEFTPTEQEFAAHVVDNIDYVLGDHDE